MGNQLPVHLSRNIRFKRILDLAITLLLCLALAPVFLAVTAAIALDSINAGERPRILIGEHRLSGGRRFLLLKFRVFRVSAWMEHLATRPEVSVKAIEREPEKLTAVGRVVKRLYLDELPQFFNILRGDMSLVGPRPYFVEDWSREKRLDIPARRLLPAGLVGPYQSVKGTVSGLDAVNALDSAYLDHLTQATLADVVRQDLALISRSIKTVLKARGL
jgi:lipopolysaccharide/colanic/teichoic acid biosynthesis glycosyltransferase